jgi:hypothetical protein
MTKTIIKILVSDAAKKLNFFPSKYGVSDYYSSRMILHKRAMDYKKHCEFTFGSLRRTMTQRMKILIAQEPLTVSI